MSVEAQARPVTAIAAPRVGSDLVRRQTRLAWILLAPSLLVVALVAIVPLLQTIYQSLTDARLADPATAVPAIAAVDIWKTTPFMALLLLAGLQVIPTDIYEAADVDGANPVQQFFRLTLPLLRPAILVALIFRTLDSLRVFDIFYVFFGSRSDTQTMSIVAQNTIVTEGNVGYGAAISVAIFLIIGIFVVIYTTFLRVQEQ